MSASDVAQKLILDGTKLAWHKDRVDAWERGERIAPITIDMALTQACNWGCAYCYAALQYNKPRKITTDIMYQFLADCKEIGVKAVSLVSDGESTLSPAYVPSIVRGHELGISMASGTHGGNLTHEMIDEVLPCLTYLRFNFSGGEPDRYAEIMGVRPADFHKVVDTIRYCVSRKRSLNLAVTIGMQMVLMPQDGDQIMPLAMLGKSIRPDYLVIKHCSDDEDGSLGVAYEKYAQLHETLRRAEESSDSEYRVIVKWSKITQGGSSTRTYDRCFGPPFLLQISGSGLVAPCGMLFNEKYKEFHIGNICETRFKDIWQSERYWEVMGRLADPKRFDPRTMCGSLCLQHKVNEALYDQRVQGIPIVESAEPEPMHVNFV